VPKYRIKCLLGYVKDKIEGHILDKAKQLGVNIVSWEIMPDHIHLFIKCNPTLSISKIVQGIKGYSSYKIRQDAPWLKYRKAFWSPSYYCETIGSISEQVVKKYIETQWDRMELHS
jgi:putative transposase